MTALFVSPVFFFIPTWLREERQSREFNRRFARECQPMTGRVVTCLRMRGTQNGPLLGIGVSGKRVDVTGIRIDRLAEDRITESWFHWDGLRMLRQLGALPNLARNPQAAPWANDNTPLVPFPTLPMPTEMPRPPHWQVIRPKSWPWPSAPTARRWRLEAATG